MSDKQIRHIVADQINDVRYCPNCGSELEIVREESDHHDRECPECGSEYMKYSIDYLAEMVETKSREELMEQEDTSELLKNDAVAPDEDIDVLRPNVDLRMERLSHRSVYVAGYDGGDDGEIDYRYWFTTTDDGELRIDREFIRDQDD
jgi:DNA-directed RNA polymerase subunit M/transcription elongation factor TFIIS